MKAETPPIKKPILQPTMTKLWLNTKSIVADPIKPKGEIVCIRDVIRALFFPCVLIPMLKLLPIFHQLLILV
jgi:hypothetical protein